MDALRKRIIVTGGTGFLGRYVMQELNNRGYSNATAVAHQEYDLTQQADVRKLYRDTAPHIVIHLAARVGGIGANIAAPGQFLYENLMMGAMLMEEGRLHNIDKFVSVGTVCSYPAETPTPFQEKDLWNGFPEPSNAPYGVAKRALLLQGQAYVEQYGLQSVFAIPTNLYGPGDNFDLATSHVIPALIRKCLAAIEQKESTITLWGSGEASRDFLYVGDCARALIDLMEMHTHSMPINLGSGEEITIAQLAALIAQTTGFTGQILWDASKPNGQKRRLVDTRAAQLAIGFKPTVSLANGLQQTVAWYKEQMAPAKIPA